MFITYKLYGTIILILQNYNVLNMKNKEHSDLVYRYNQTLGKLKHWLHRITLLKQEYWSPYDYRDQYSFNLDHKWELKECKENVNHYSEECKNTKNYIKSSNRNYNKKNIS